MQVLILLKELEPFLYLLLKICTYQSKGGGIFVSNAIAVREALLAPLEIGGVITQLYIIPLAKKAGYQKSCTCNILPCCIHYQIISYDQESFVLSDNF